MAFPGSRLPRSFSRTSVLACGFAASLSVAALSALALLTPASCIDGTTPNCADAACSIAFDGGPDTGDGAVDGKSSDTGTDTSTPVGDAGDAGAATPDSGQGADASDAAQG